MILWQIFLVIIIALTIAGMVAPSEAIGWWQRRNTSLPDLSLAEQAELNHATGVISWPSIEQACAAPALPSDPADDFEVPMPRHPDADQEFDHYLVYLSGIGTSGPDQLPVFEIPMVDALSRRLGRTAVIWDVYPYSVENQSLTSGRKLSVFWRRLRKAKFNRTAGRRLASLINIRNAYQMLVSSDERYGPVFNLAVALQIAAALLRHGYVPEDGKPVTLLGWSGGGQIAAGATWYLAALGIPVRVMSMAGLISSDPGLDRAEHIWHLHGDHDKVERIGAVLFAGRWPIFRSSSWNRALTSGRMEEVSLGDLDHVGKTGYFSPRPLPDGRIPREETLNHITSVLVKAGLASDLGGDAFAASPEV